MTEALKELAERHNLLMGTYIGSDTFENKKMKGFTKKHFNLITAGDMTTFEHPIRYDFFQSRYTINPETNKMEPYIKFAVKNNMKILSSIPLSYADYISFLSTLPDAEKKKELKKYVKKIVSYYGDKVHIWNISNEVFDKLGILKTYNHLTKNYLNIMLIAAHKMNPNALLILNDFGIEEINTKSTGIYNWINNAKKQGLPIGGIGIQCHLSIERPINYISFRNNIRRFHDLGIKVLFTEIDVRIHIEDGLTDAELNVQKDYYYSTIKLAKEEKIYAVNFWGIHDDNWIPYAFQGYGAACMLTYPELKRKPAYYGIRKALQ